MRLAMTGGWWCALMFLSGVAPAAAQSPPPADQYALPNGLKVLVWEDHSAPLTTVNLWYHAGSGTEQPGHTGVAHLIERLMFQGSEHVPAGRHRQLVEEAGGEIGIRGNEERTGLSSTVPSSHLELALWLEADRMRSLALTEQAVQNQRPALEEERRMRIDNQPYGAAFLRGLSFPFDSATCFPYSHSVLGSATDLEATSFEDVRAFHRAHYHPGNATLVVTGDVDRADVRRLVETLFGGIPGGTVAGAPQCAVSYSAGARKQELQDALAQRPAVIAAYRVPPHADGDSPALQLLSLILGNGEGSRLSRALVHGRQVALQAASGLESRRGPGVLYLYAIAADHIDGDTLAAAVGAEIARLGRDIQPDELERARGAFRAQALFARETTRQLAEELQHYAAYHARLADMTAELEQVTRLTVADLQRVASRYLRPENASTTVVRPAGGGGGGGGGGGHAHEEDE